MSFYALITTDDGDKIIGVFPHLETVQHEAKRLATENPGCRYYIMEPRGYYMVDPLPTFYPTLEDCEFDETD